MPASIFDSCSRSSQRYHWLAYYYGLRSGRRLKPHHVRDGAALADLSVPLARLGLSYGHLVPNGPPTPEEYSAQRAAALDAVSGGGQQRIEDVATYTRIDESFLQPGDMLVVPTRPPMDDIYHGDKVHSQPGFTSIEQKIFQACRPYLQVCSRAHIRLSLSAAGWLPDAFANRADVTFYQIKEPWYLKLARLDGGGRRAKVSGQTAGYVLYLPALESLRGAGLLVVFGMGGTQTLVLCHRLRSDLAWLFDEPGFTMIEMTAPEDEPAFNGLEFAHEWKLETIFHMECVH
jgi:hypothetical protein